MNKINLKHHRHLIPLFFLILVAVIFRIPGLGRSLWVDEIYSLQTLRVNLIENPIFWGVEIHQPLYFYLLRIWNVLAQIIPSTNKIFLFRVFNIGISLFTISFIYKYFSKIDNRKAAIIFGLLIAISPIHIYFSQELRPYILLSTLLIVQFYFFIKLIKEETKQAKILFVLFGILSILTHLVAVFIFNSYLVLLVILYFKSENKRLIKQILTSVVILILLSLFLMFVTKLNPMYETSKGSFNPYLRNFEGFTINFIIETFQRFKEVFTMYYWYGYTYNIVSQSVQFIFKKVIFLIIAASFIYPFIKSKSKSFLNERVAIFLLIFTLIQVYITERLGLFPFGGRYIMPFSIFLHYIVAKFLYHTKNIKYSSVIIGIGIIIMSLQFTFHEICYYKLPYENKEYLKTIQTEAYNICIKEFELWTRK